MSNFVVVVFPREEGQSAPARRGVTAIIARNPDEWQLVRDNRDLIVARRRSQSRSSFCYEIGEDRGVAFGVIFRREGASGSRSGQVRFDDATALRIAATRGKYLTDNFWGAYVAVVWGDGDAGVFVCRDPTDNVPCYHARVNGADVFFSRFQDYLDLFRIEPEVDMQQLGFWLHVGQPMGRDSCVKSIEALAPGCCYRLEGGSISTALLWNPAEIATSQEIRDPRAAATELRRSVQFVVDAWAGRYGKIAHKLSGGLDSSIIAGCLATSASCPEVRYLNFWIDPMQSGEVARYPSNYDAGMMKKIRFMAGSGDERHAARLVAEKFSVGLTERARNSAVDVSRFWLAPLSIGPSMYFTCAEIDDAEVELAREFGIEAFFSGQGGDSALFASMQPFAAVDYLYSRVWPRRLWRHLRDSAMVSRESLAAVLGKSLRSGLLRLPYRYPTAMSLADRPSLLSREFRDNLRTDGFDEAPDYPGLDQLAPGKRDHVLGVGRSSYYDYVFFSGDFADHVDPLNAQPVWECVLRVPTYILSLGGVSRGLARGAFSDLLPDQIRKRVTKGTGGPFYQTVVRRNWERIRETLLGGRLSRVGLLDRKRLESCQSASELFVVIPATQVLSCLAGEIWLGKLAELRQRAAA